MAALASISDVINRMTGGAGAAESLWGFKDWRIGSAAATTPQVGFWHSLWLMNGQPAGAAAAPGAVAAPTVSTSGSLLQTNPGGGRQKWLTGWSGTCAQPGSFLLYDRLLHISGLSGTSTSAQTVGGSITRNTGGVGNEIWVEIYTTIGTTATTITASYVNSSGVSHTTPTRVIGGTGNREAQRMLQLPLADGDVGVQSVTSVTLAASTTTAGDFGVTIVRPLLTASVDDNAVGWVRDTLTAVPGPVEVVTDACLALMFMANSTSAPTAIVHNLNFVEA